MPGFIDKVSVDMITNGRGSGQLSQEMVSGRYTLEPSVGWDAGLLRPVIQNDGNRYCLIKTGHQVRNKEGTPSYTANQAAGEMVAESKYIPLQTLINNGTIPFTANASALTYQAWQKVDRAVIKASRQRLQAWNDLAAANSFGGFDGMSITGLIRDTMTDSGEAKVDMDTLSDDFSDAALFAPDILPLPIIHAGAKMSERRLAVSRNNGMPLDVDNIEQAARRCAETLERMTIGTLDLQTLVIGNDTTFTNNGIYGFRTHPDRIPKSDLTTPIGWTEGSSAQTLVNEVLEMIELARAKNLFGPFVLYFSTQFDQFLEHDYYVINTQGAAAPHQTVRQRLEQIAKIQRVAPLDFFTPDDPELLLVQMTSETVRAVNGMEFTPVQWQVNGGAETMIRCIGIKVPDLRSQFVGTSTTITDRVAGIVHATTP